jgi:site-specific DNA-methyltransferase (adenine-specific)
MTVDLKAKFWDILPNIRIIEGDAMQTLPQLPISSFDLVVLDPPYLIATLPNVWDEHKNALQPTIDFDTLFKELYRVMKDDSTMVMFGHLSTFMKLWQKIEGVGFKYITDIVWVKPCPINRLQSKKKPLSQHETITVWAKGKFRYNWEGALSEGEPYTRSRMVEDPFYKSIGHVTNNTGFRFMTDVVFAPSKPQMPFKERTEHPTQKPLDLIKKLILAFSFEGDFVLDPFAGSGTTLDACAETNRKCVGIEIDPKYIEIIKTRLGKKLGVQASLNKFSLLGGLKQ